MGTGGGSDPAATAAAGCPRSAAAAPPPSAARLSRWAREAAARSRFACGDELHELRARAAELGRAGAGAEAAGMRERDPDFVYAVTRELAERAASEGDDASAAEYRRKMEDARSSMPQMNLHGLWVGK
jgi:hypothetical protein